MTGPHSGACPTCGSTAPTPFGTWPFCSRACQTKGRGNAHGFVSDNSAVLCKLLAEARGLIAEHVPIEAGSEWMEKLHGCPQFKDPDPPE